MKKFLTMGAAALVIGASFTSCSKDKDLYDPEAQAQNFLKNYESAFVEVFGQPSADQTWGFGTAAQARVTRSVDTNANEWADEKGGSWVVPDPLTEDQKLRVKAYFQAHPYLTYEDPNFTDFFVQQVYKGGEAPGGLTTEVYSAGNGASVTGGGQMDYLTFGSKTVDGQLTFVDHTNNFNSATGGYTNVLDNGQPVNGGTTHRDQIMLMIGSQTDCVGFHETHGGVDHITNHCALASAADIDKWAVEEGNNIGAAVTDKWERSFVGLDYEAKGGEDVYYKNWQTGEKMAVKLSDLVDPNSKVVIDNGAEVSINNYNLNEVLTNKYNQTIYYLTNNANSFLGEEVQHAGKTALNQNNKFNLDLLRYWIDQNALPTESNKDFIKNIGGRDYVYSDWIVSLSKAKHVVPPTEEYLDTPDYRIIAEDLNVGDSRSDFDFNDIVFDVYYNQLNATKAKIKVQAAGGTMPLEIRTAGLTAEVHNLFGVATTDMVNTGAGPDVADANKPFFEVTIDKSVADDNIKLYVNNGTAAQPAWNELTAVRGRVASKIKVAHTYQYCSEREDIEVKYPLFKQWVTDPSVKWY